MKTLLRLAAILILLLSAAPALNAQQNINRAIAEAEKASSTNYVVYSEKRDPQTHKVYKSSKVLIVSKSEANRISKAFQKDREKSTSYELFDYGRGYQLTFTTRSDRTQYTLIRQKNDKWLLTVEQSPLPRNARRNTCTPSPTSDTLYIQI